MIFERHHSSVPSNVLCIDGGDDARPADSFVVAGVRIRPGRRTCRGGRVRGNVRLTRTGEGGGGGGGLRIVCVV